MTIKKEDMTDIDNRVLAVKQLLEAFKLERILYVVISGIAVIVLLVVAIMNLDGEGEQNATWFASLFVPAGAITYSISRILKMWNQALTFVNNQKVGKDGE